MLKLHKRAWFPESAPGCEIFLSAWIDADALRLARVNYNINALKLRQIPGHSIQSRDFAAAVKAAGKPVELIVGEGFNHFEMQETLGNPYGIAGRAALKLMNLNI